ncbi:MAG: glycosyltransferase, partial [Pseudobdellovibrionaceae bacterium]
MKHLVFLTEHLSFGGAERALVEYLASIDKSKYKVSLILRDEIPENYLLSSVPPDVEIKILYKQNEQIGYWKSLRKKLCFKFDLTMRLKKALRELGHVDLLLDFNSVLLKIANFFPQYQKIFWIHGPKTHMGPAELKKFSFRLRSYDLVAVVSDHLKSEIEYLLPHLKKKVALIYNPFDIERILKSGEDEADLSAQEKILIKDRYILAVGRFAVEKDYNTLIRAYDKLLQKGVDFKLYIIGDGPARFEIQEKIKTLGLQEHVILLGAKENPYIWMKKSILFVHSALIEGFGLVLVEAMILGKAVVATDCPVGPREILSNGQYGKLVKVADAEAVANAVKDMVDDEKIRKEFQALSLV